MAFVSKRFESFVGAVVIVGVSSFGLFAILFVSFCLFVCLFYRIFNPFFPTFQTAKDVLRHLPTPPPSGIKDSCEQDGRKHQGRIETISMCMEDMLERKTNIHTCLHSRNHRYPNM